MMYESVVRILNPVAIAFTEAIWVTGVGLVTFSASGSGTCAVSTLVFVYAMTDLLLLTRYKLLSDFLF